MCARLLFYSPYHPLPLPSPLSLSVLFFLLFSTQLNIIKTEHTFLCKHWTYWVLWLRSVVIVIVALLKFPDNRIELNWWKKDGRKNSSNNSSHRVLHWTKKRKFAEKLLKIMWLILLRFSLCFCMFLVLSSLFFFPILVFVQCTHTHTHSDILIELKCVISHRDSNKMYWSPLFAKHAWCEYLA